MSTGHCLKIVNGFRTSPGMSRLKWIPLLCALIGTLSSPLQADNATRVYSGLEAQALRCAAYFTYSTYVLEQRGLLTWENREEGAKHATEILGRYVGGTYEQKFQAFQTMLRRMPAEDAALIDESLRHLGWCSERFLG